MRRLRSPSRTELTRIVVPRALSAERAWAAIFSFVLLHELTCQPGQLLSEGVDRALVKQPVLTYGFTAVTVAHLLNLLPPRLDPYARTFRIIQRLKGNK